MDGIKINSRKEIRSELTTQTLCVCNKIDLNIKYKDIEMYIRNLDA